MSASEPVPAFYQERIAKGNQRAMALKIEGCDGGVAIVTIDREARLNAINDAVLLGLLETLRRARAGEFTAVVITGVGTRAFSSGSDVKELATLSHEGRLEHTVLGNHVLAELEEHPCLVFAAIEGYCLGGGLELALACDFRFAGSDATFGLPEVQINALPTWGGTVRLSKVVGLGRAKEMVLLGRKLTADEALAWGLVAEVVPAGHALSRALDVARLVTKGSAPLTLALAKSLTHFGDGLPNRTAGYMEYLADMTQSASGDQEAAFASFTKKSRQPHQVSQDEGGS